MTLSDLSGIGFADLIRALPDPPMPDQQSVTVQLERRRSKVRTAEWLISAVYATHGSILFVAESSEEAQRTFAQLGASLQGRKGWVTNHRNRTAYYVTATICAVITIKTAEEAAKPRYPTFILDEAGRITQVSPCVCIDQLRASTLDRKEPAKGW